HTTLVEPSTGTRYFPSGGWISSFNGLDECLNQLLDRTPSPAHSKLRRTPHILCCCRRSPLARTEARCIRLPAVIAYDSIHNYSESSPSMKLFASFFLLATSAIAQGPIAGTWSGNATVHGQQVP